MLLNDDGDDHDNGNECKRYRKDGDYNDDDMTSMVRRLLILQFNLSFIINFPYDSNNKHFNHI